MKIYIKYILGNIVAPCFFITFSLTCVVWLTQSLKFIDLIVNQGLPVGEFLNLIMLLLPSLVSFVLPIATFCAVVFTYNKLGNESELLVLKAAGISNYGISRPAVILALMMTALAYTNSLFVLPITYSKFKDMQTYFRDNYASVLLEEGIFNSPIQGLTIYIGSKSDDGTLEGILVHDNRKADRPLTMIAEKAVIERGTKGLRFLMQNASQQQVNKRSGEVSFLYFDSYPLDISYYAKNSMDRLKKSEELFVPELLHPDSSLPEKIRNKQIADGHFRITWPLTNLSVALVALSCLLSGGYNRRGQSKRILLAVALSVAVIAASIAFRNIAADGKAIGIYLMYVPIIISLLSFIFIVNNFRSAKKIIRGVR